MVFHEFVGVINTLIAMNDNNDTTYYLDVYRVFYRYVFDVRQKANIVNYMWESVYINLL